MKLISVCNMTLKTHRLQIDGYQLCVDTGPEALLAFVQTPQGKSVGDHLHVRSSTKLDNKRYLMPFDDDPDLCWDHWYAKRRHAITPLIRDGRL